MSKLTLTHKGRDSWSRPVYECEGRLFVDVSPCSGWNPDICTKSGNAFDGEPDTPINYIERYKDAEVEFIPQRDVWH